MTKAAAALGMAPSALTAQLQRIERAVGGVLFDRDRRGTRPTALGEFVLARARVLLPAVRDLQDEANRLAATGETLSRYRIGATNGPIVGGLVQQLNLAHAQAHVSTYASWSAEELAEMLLAGKLDFGVVGVCGDAAPPAGQGLIWRTISLDAVFILMTDQHPLAGLPEVDLGELAGEQWANAPGDSCFSDCFAAACARSGFTPRHVFETDVGGCIDLLTSGAAVVLCQGTFRQVPGITMVPIAGTPLTWRHLLGYRGDGVEAGVADDVLGHATTAYLETVGSRPWYADWLRDHPELGAQSTVPA
ncbi:DNA-binding transcriptional LysR family regulator [Allocatelliglobosispora scoriae]|uniref:DNA-binding transcriptional LysR family regulator n=1 Tax=Allocatelliglobosispora scoriae TaxID=643052 RepID=A0A841BXF4_9ACTN|nr:DNA-binding transcriptional LysR family regulator [Allocatelliglobosispora scoriae]